MIANTGKCVQTQGKTGIGQKKTTPNVTAEFQGDNKVIDSFSEKQFCRSWLQNYIKLEESLLSELNKKRRHSFAKKD